MNSTFIEIASTRRSIYALGKKLTVPDSEIAALVKSAVKVSPTAFHNQLEVPAL